MVYDEPALEVFDVAINEDFSTTIASIELDDGLEASRTDSLDARLLVIIKALDR